MNFFNAVIESLYSVDFYKRLIREPLTRGLVYLVNWSALICFLFSLFLGIRIYPEVRGFLDWVEGTMPPIQWTPEGMRMSRKSPFEMKHPKYGHFATFQFDKKEATDAEIGDAMVYVTSTKLYVRENERQGKRVYDLTSKETVKTKRENMTIDGEMIHGLEKNLRPLLIGVTIVFIFVVFFIWRLIGALFYSLIGMMINLFRREKLSYEAILNISFFAMTASLLIQIILTLLGDAVRIPFGFWGSLIFTTTYLYLGIKFTEEALPPVYED